MSRLLFPFSCPSVITTVVSTILFSCYVVTASTGCLPGAVCGLEYCHRAAGCLSALGSWQAIAACQVCLAWLLAVSRDQVQPWQVSLRASQCSWAGRSQIQWHHRQRARDLQSSWQTG